MHGGTEEEGGAGAEEEGLEAEAAEAVNAAGATENDEDDDDICPYLPCAMPCASVQKSAMWN